MPYRATKNMSVLTALLMNMASAIAGEANPVTDSILLGSRTGSLSRSIVTTRLSPDGKRLLTGHLNNKIRCWDIQSGKLLKEMDGDVPIRSLEWYPDKDVAIIVGYDGNTRTRDLATCQQIAIIPGLPANVASIAFSRAGKHYAVGCREGLVQVRGLARGELIAESRPHRSLVESVSFVSSSETIVISTGSEGQIQVWDYQNRKQLFSLQAKNPAASYSLGSNRVAYIVSQEGATSTVRVWDLSENRLVRDVSIQETRLRGVSLSHDGRLLAVVGSTLNSSIVLVELLTGSVVCTLPETNPNKMRSDLVFSSDARRLISSTGGVFATNWDLTRQIGDKEPQSISDFNAIRTKLSSSDASEAYRTICNLVAFPDQTIRSIQDYLCTTPIEKPQLMKLIQDLDNRRFTIRERAFCELVRVRHTVVDELRVFLSKDELSLEQRKRVTELLDTLPDDHRFLSRTVTVLEYMGTRESQRYLQRLAAGPPDAHLTREASSAARRLNLRLNRSMETVMREKKVSNTDPQWDRLDFVLVRPRITASE